MGMRIDGEKTARKAESALTAEIPENAEANLFKLFPFPSAPR